MSTRPMSIFEHLEALGNPRDPRTAGNRLRIVRQWKDDLNNIENRIWLQLGVDTAKHLIARGIQPQNRPVLEVLADHEAKKGDAG